LRFPAALATTEHLRARVSEMKQDTGLWQEGMVREASARQKCHGIAEELMGEILQVKSDACEALQALGMMWAIVVREFVKNCDCTGGWTPFLSLQ